ncbi:hypothetical protein Gasu2_56690 [Galdieria sulphuraria]|nr:hypothetical protein Gasu2_52980 [Galdieria sulphuraria]GJD11535.1 hypothetical protein Gasu2_56690 [Galdieria sulphuraria]
MWRLFRLSTGRLVSTYNQVKHHTWNKTKYSFFSTFDRENEKPIKESPRNQPTESSLSSPTETHFADSEQRQEAPLRGVIKSSKFRQVDRSKLIHEYYPELRIKPPYFEYEPDRDRLIYQAPYFQAPIELIRSLSTEEIISALKEYAGFLKGDREILLNRLIFYTRPRPEELIHGKVSSTRMNKTATVVSRRPCFYKRLKVRTFRFRKFMAHDEFNLCDEVVENYGKRIPTMANMEELILKAREKLLEETVQFEKRKNISN